jgi:DNA sulfur modification protein DndB
MATSLPAFKGSFGSTDFFVLTMQAGEFVKSMTIPKELEEWEDLSPEEKFQREINYKRVATHIAPYLAHDEDRFFGAFIVEVRQHEEMEFESLVDAGAKFPKALPNSLMNKFGILYLSGSEVMIPLDGQHRLAALEFAISGKDEKKNDIKGLTPNPKVASDTCTVILLKHDLEKARKIFNKVNKYAKPTSKADNLITDDSNYIAVITRESIVGNIIPARLVRSNSGNTLPPAAPEFTTLATVYEINYSVEEHFINRKPDLIKLPRPEDVYLTIQNLEDFWTQFTKILPYQHSLIDPSEDGDERRQEIRKGSLSCKPIVQRTLAEVVLSLLIVGVEETSKLSIPETVSRINKLDWAPENPLWQGILLNGEKIISGPSSMKLAARMIAYLLGQKLETVELDKLKESFQTNNPSLDFPVPSY